MKPHKHSERFRAVPSGRDAGPGLRRRALAGLLVTWLGCSLAQSPVLTQSPANQTIFLGDPATFRASATGTAPLAYQWFRNGALLPGATGSNYVISAIASSDHDAAFSVRVTNSLGTVTSTAAVLTVDFGIPGAPVTNRVLNFNSDWRYNQSNNLDGLTWFAPQYNDASWQNGAGLLAAENNTAITPLINTTLVAPSAPPAGLSSGHAYYFRTTVTLTNDFIPAALIATLRADDGAMIYVNGQEALRLRMAAGEITNLSFTTSFPPGSGSEADVDETHSLEVSALQPGTNLIAASVHQANSGSSDVVWGMALDATGYQRLRDTVAPSVISLLPSAGTVVPSLATLEVHFSETVKGVDASDLRVNGVPATNLVVYAPDVYLFQFPPPPTGAVVVAWSAGHGIIDRSANSNAFGGGSYSFTVDPTAISSEVRITEFMAGNTTLRDDQGEFSDWIEIFNSGTQPLSLGGWYLTDSDSARSKWRFPSGVVIPASSYLLVWASGENHTNPAAPLHTNFKLSKSPGSFLALVYSDGATIISSFANYPQQYDDVSYGCDRLDASVLGYFTNATPGAANATLGAGFASEVHFSRPSGTFQTSFNLTLSTDSSNTVIRYFLVTNATSAALTNVPNSTSDVYTGPLTISGNLQVRARAFSTQTNLFPGPPSSATYLQITAAAANFSSALPIVLLHNFGGGTPPASLDQAGVMMVFGTDYGRASLTNPPDVATRIGVNIRGSSTQGMTKRSFAVETWDEYNDDADVAVLGMPADSDWVLYAPNFFDKPLIHNPFLYELSRQLDRYAPRTRMVEVFTNFGVGAVTYVSPTAGHYYGLFVLEEKIKAGDGRVDIPRLDPVETNAPAVTGGYMLKVDRADADERTLYAANLSMVFVEPQMKDFAAYPGRTVQQNYISSYFNSFYSALTGANWTNPATGYAAWMDVDSWVDHHILSVFSLSADALRLSAYFFKDRNGKIEMGPVWDFDRSMGTSAGSDWRAWNPRSWIASNPLGSPTGGDYGTDYFNPAGVFSNPWYGQLVKDPDFWQKWIDRYQELRGTKLSTNSLFALIDGLTNQLAQAQIREQSKWAGQGDSDTSPRAGTVTPPAGWPDTSYVHVFPGTYAGEIAFQKRWLADRLNFIDTNFLATPTLSATGGLVGVGSSVTLTPASKAGSRLLFTLNGTDPRLPGGGIAPGALSNTTAVTLSITNNVRIVARSWNPSHANLTGANNPPISSPWSGPTKATFFINVPPLRITEIMFHPPQPPAGNTNDADNFEYLEFKNIGSTPLNLQGFTLSGGVDFVFSSLTLTGGQHTVLVRNLAAFQSRYGTNVLIAGVVTNNLGNDGDHLVLRGPLQEPILDFRYQDNWYPTTDGLGFSLGIVNSQATPDTWGLKSSWRPSASANGSPGQANPSPATIPGVLITEALTHTDPPLVDTVELFNPTTSPANVGGWFLTDEPATPNKYRIPSNTFIAAQGYLTLTSNQFGLGPNGFSFSSTGDRVYLFSGDATTNLTGYAHGFDFGAAPNPVSFGRYVNSGGDEQFVLQSVNTLGLANAYPRIGPVVISEIMYHPPDVAGEDDNLNEFIELQNIATTNTPLYDPTAPTNTWRLRGAVDFSFPANTMLTPGSRVLVVGFDPAFYSALRSAFITKYSAPTNTLIFGPWSGKLDNSGDSILLECPDHPNVTPTNIFVPYYLVEQVAYRDSAPWPTNADGSGASLQRIEATLFANDPANWQAALPTPAQSNPPGPTPDADHDGLPDLWELASGLDPQSDSGLSGAMGDPDGDGANNQHEFVAGTNPNNALDYLRFSSVEVTNQTCRLSFVTRAGRVYSVERIVQFAATNQWSGLQSEVVGTGTPQFVSDSITNSARYYRLKVRLAP